MIWPLIRRRSQSRPLRPVRGTPGKRAPSMSISSPWPPPLWWEITSICHSPPPTEINSQPKETNKSSAPVSAALKNSDKNNSMKKPAANAISSSLNSPKTKCLNTKNKSYHSTTPTEGTPKNDQVHESTPTNSSKTTLGIFIINLVHC